VLPSFSQILNLISFLFFSSLQDLSLPWPMVTIALLLSHFYFLLLLSFSFIWFFEINGFGDLYFV